DGPPVMLTPKAATALGMVFYELATNAVKYGALSVGAGRVDVTWRTEMAEKGERLRIEWTESGGPPPQAGAGAGFGTGFIRRAVEFELEGAVEMELKKRGLACRLQIPLRGNVQQQIVLPMPVPPVLPHD